MSISLAYSAQLTGLATDIVTVEVDISNGLHAFSVVGLGDRSVEEAKDRISAAIKNSGFISPKQKNQKVVISLAPADLRKEGPSFDMAMTMAYLAAAGDIELDPDRKLFLGEVSLEGRIRRVGGVLPILCQAPARGFTAAYIPAENAREAALARNIMIYPVSSIKQLAEHFTGGPRLKPLMPADLAALETDAHEKDPASIHEYDFASIRGNEAAKRALEIAAAGFHNILMCGPPGTGKTMLARSLASIVPALSFDHAVEVTGIHSAARMLKEEFIVQPPFRAPHHTASYPAIIGGGGFPRPGEVTLAHRGILFLDEFPEFSREVIEALRQPLEERSVTISRAKAAITFPAQCLLIASMNPCPCGLGRDRGCTCPERLVHSYLRKVSGPVADRIDIWINVAKIDYDRLSERSVTTEHSSAVRERVRKARRIQAERFKEAGSGICFNSEMSVRDIEKAVVLQDDARHTLKLAAQKLGLSGRAFHRVIKVAQTIADLAGEREIKKDFILEALQYRKKDS